MHSASRVGRECCIIWPNGNVTLSYSHIKMEARPIVYLQEITSFHESFDVSSDLKLSKFLKLFPNSLYSSNFTLGKVEQMRLVIN